MRHIKKSSEPKKYSDWRKKNKPQNYGELSPEIKQHVKQALLTEQYHLCCYCEKSINIENTTIEHLLPKDKSPQKQLDYSNFLASCNSKNHCNQKRGNEPLEVNPLQKDIESKFQFFLTYRNRKTPVINIKGNEQVIKTLNLNDNTLQRQRGKTLLGLTALYGCFDVNTLDTEDVKKIVESISNADENGKLQEFATAILQVLSISNHDLQKHK